MGYMYWCEGVNGYSDDKLTLMSDKLEYEIGEVIVRDDKEYEVVDIALDTFSISMAELREG